MGIRFYCPNGHKLNVKEFQAGRKGICPFCGARIQIPMQSTRPSVKGRQGGAARGGQDAKAGDSQSSDSAPDILPGEPPSLPGDPPGRSMLGPSTPIAPVQSAVVAPPTAPSGARGPVATTQANVPTATAKPSGGPTDQPLASQGGSGAVAANANLAITTAAKPASEANAPAVSGPVTPPPPQDGNHSPSAAEPPDPIAEAPDMIWYVRPPSGGQFGPAPGELMRTWVTEGRVSADSLVWREGWRDWQEAAVVFPKLRANQFMDFLDATPAAAAAPASSPTATHVDPTKERTKIDRTFILLIFLSVVAVILVLTLVFVILYYK